MERQYLDFFLGTIPTVAEGKKANKVKDSGQYSLITPRAGNNCFAFDLKAFCAGENRFVKVYAEYNTLEANRVYGIISSTEGISCDTQRIWDLNDSEGLAVRSGIYSFRIKEEGMLIPAPDGKMYHLPQAIIGRRLELPDFWVENLETVRDAVAVPIFADQREASQDWFGTQRVLRSKLVMIQSETGYRSFYCCDHMNEEPQPRNIVKSDFDEKTCTFDGIPYVLMQRDLYDSICNPDAVSVAKNETSFLEEFQSICKAEGYLFEETDLWNFHTSVKSGYLTILEGLSGTGKSSIVRLYQKAFGDDNCKLCFLSVSPAWTDDSELLGYWDPRKNEYVYTELLDILKEAQEEKNRRRLYLICLDEMNLARVEHYFYRILSVMEKPLGERIMLLHNDKENADKRVSVEIGDNVRFVGTVNVDDTTFSFADKVRDRANIISLQVEDYSKKPFTMSGETQGNGTAQNKVKKAYFFSEFVRTYGDLTSNQEEKENDQEAKLREFLWSLHKTLCRDNSSFGVSPRTVRAIGTYLANYPINDGKTLNKEALDFQINQRILTKLHGSAELLEDLLKEYHPLVTDGEKSSVKLANEKDLGTSQKKEDEQTDANEKKSLDQLLREKQLTASCATLSRKRKDLENYGYCP